MRKLAIYYLPAFLIVILTGCPGDDPIDLPSIDFNVNLSHTLPVSVANTNEMTTSVVIDATTDSEIDKYLSKIENYEITELKFAVENYTAPNEDEVYFNGQVGFSKSTESQATATCDLNNLNITHIAGTGDFEVKNCNSLLSGISDMFTAENSIKVYLIGTFSKAPLAFDLEVSMKVKVTAKPL